MGTINSSGYLDRRSNSSKSTNAKATRRNWWLAGENLNLGLIKIPKEYYGKRLRFKVEIVK